MNIKQIRRAESMLTEIIQDKISGKLENSVLHTTRKLALEAGLTLIDTSIKNLENLITLRFRLREIVAQANKEMGIDKRKAEMGMLTAKIEMLGYMKDKTVRTVTDYSTSPRTEKYQAGITEDKRDAINSEIRSLRLRIASLKDSCGGINSSTKVELPNEVLEQLKTLGCII